MSTDKQVFKGSCSCGNVKYTVALPPGPKTAQRCNCTFCTKLGFVGIKPEKEDFKLLSPASYEELPEYKLRRFCPTCSVMVLGVGSYEFQGQTHDFFSVNAATIDQPQEGIDLSEFQITYWDGLHDNWMAGMKDRPYPGGLI